MEQALKTTILLFVPDPLVRAVFEENLRHAGYMVRSVGDLGNAVDRLKESKADLLITRTHVQSMPGHEAAMFLVKQCPSMRVLIVGGLLDDDRLLNRELLQGFAIFPKPYPASELLAEVKRVLKTKPEPAPSK